MLRSSSGGSVCSMAGGIEFRLKSLIADGLDEWCMGWSFLDSTSACLLINRRCCWCMERRVFEYRTLVFVSLGNNLLMVMRFLPSRLTEARGGGSPKYSPPRPSIIFFLSRGWLGEEGHEASCSSPRQQSFPALVGATFLVAADGLEGQNRTRASGPAT